MANPQKEKGFIGIAYDIFEQFFIRDFSILQLKMLLLIVRFSYGFGKKVAKIKPQRLFELAYIYRCDIKEELKFLRQNKVITYNLEYGEIQLNKNYDEWKIPYHKLFNEDDLLRLKKINMEAKNLAKEFGIPDEVHTEVVCAEQTEMFADNKQTNAEKLCTEQRCLPSTNKVVCAEQTEMFADNKQTNAENIDSESDTTSPIYKDIEDIENNTIYICNSKEIQTEEKTVKRDDPYTGKIQAKFCAIYKEVFGKPCYLNNAQRIALVEIKFENPDFEENLPVLIEKFSKIKFMFDGKVQKVGLRWLLEQGNWSGVLSGDFDNNIEDEKENDGWDL